MQKKSMVHCVSVYVGAMGAIDGIVGFNVPLHML